jgi:hypothetical protein
MDDAYDELRRQALDKRRRIVAAADLEYRATIRRIKSLRKMVTGKQRAPARPPQHAPERTLASIMLEACPRDRSFTIADACELVYAHPLGCQYKEASIRATFTVLQGMGAIHKVGRRQGRLLWALKESSVELAPFGTLTLYEIAETLIKEFGPMRENEIAARMRERGYKSEYSGALLHGKLRSAMMRIGGRFVKDQAGRWAASGEPAPTGNGQDVRIE